MLHRVTVGAALLLVSLAVAVGTPAPVQAASDSACWGQVSALFAQMGLMGEHASSFDTPRLGLRNLARTLHEAGIIADDSMRSLGQFVARETGLEVDACA
jgi:hypothetical protein